jgi:hypothetical protein
MGPFEMMGIVHGDRGLLVAAEWDESPFGSLVPVQSDSDHGWLRVSKGWFGTNPEYAFVADDGRVTALKPTTKAIEGCNIGSLGY